MRFAALYDKLHHGDPITWLGHGVQGVAMFYFLLWATGSDQAAVLAVLVAFAHREVSDALAWAREPKATRRDASDKMLDGVLDFFVPLLAIGVVRGVLSLFGL